jgi:PAS domain S-box-containing protein
VASLVTSEDGRYRLLVDSITDYAIYMLDRDGVVISWNQGAQRSKGYTSDEILGQHFSRFYTEEDRRAGLPAIALRTAAEEGRFEREGWRIRKDGTRFWAHVVIDPVRDEGGCIIGFAKITRDFTERRRSEYALRESEEQFRRLVQGVTDYAIFMLDRGGRVTSWNAGAQRIKGYAPDEIIGEHFSRFYTKEDQQAGMPRSSLEHAAREGQFRMEGWRVRKNGTRFMAHVVIDAIRDDAGEVIGFAKVTRDITEKKNAQQSLEQALQALFQTQKLESLGKLTGGMAHDFNNLLTVILASLELLRKRLPDDARARALLDNAVHGAERGATLTQRMLAFARRQDLKYEAIDVASLVSGMMGLLERSVGPGIGIEAEFPPSLPAVHSDPNQLETALLNLALNARDAMPDGGTISIKAREETVGKDSRLGLPRGCYVCLSATDSGLGMDEQTMARATEPFFTTKGVGKGTGLGLSMVQGLAEQSGGKLTIESLLGRGTTINVWLPASTSEVAQTRKAPEDTDRSAALQSSLILVVDDDELVLSSTSALLEDIGYVVIEASSAMHALECIAQNPDIDLLLTDHAMPGMTGLQLTRAVRELRPDLPVILATGYAELPADIPREVRRLTKPFRAAELADAVSMALAPEHA